MNENVQVKGKPTDSVEPKDQPEVDNNNKLEIENVPMPEVKPLEIVLGEGIFLEKNDIEVKTTEEQVAMIRSHVRGKMLKQFGVTEIAKTPVNSGKLYFNGNTTAMKLPKVTTDENGRFTETLQRYFDRVKPEIQIWLLQSVQNSAITVEQVVSMQ